MCTSVNSVFSLRVIAAIPALLLACCAVGPKYVRPTVETPAAWKESTGTLWRTARPSDDAPRGKWWERFGDPRLNDLEAKLDGSNQSIAAAAAAVQAARALIRESRSQYLPTIGAAPAITNSRLSTFGPKPAGVTYAEFSLPVQASWEPDLWGRVRGMVSASTFSAQASMADLENVRLAAQADLAADYFQLRAQDDLKQVLDATVNSYREAMELTRKLCDAGLDTDEAVSQAESQWEAARAQTAGVSILRAQYEHAIAVLIGKPAPSFAIPAESVKTVLPAVPLAVPSELLERRPDIAAAERAVAQANAEIGVAMAAFYPNLTLSAAGGLENLSAAQWLTWPSRVWSVGPALAETLFDGGLRKATVQQYRSAYDQTVANYRQTVLTAFGQVEDNLTAIQALSVEIEEQNEAVGSAERSLRVATVRYEAGLEPWLTVVAARTALLNQRQVAVGYEAQRVLADVQLIRALGGGWNEAGSPGRLGRP
jgi:NodT family efflux transporter outer membrane factor (OMF) lipoprotein